MCRQHSVLGLRMRAPDGRRSAYKSPELQLGKNEYIEPGLIAMIWTGLGNNDRALELLQEEYRLHASFAVSMGSDPVFEPLHSDRRFQALLRRLGLP